MIEKLSTELKASLYQRIISPYFGTYLIGLFIFNYRFILLLFSDLSFKDKFDLIDSGNNFIHLNFSLAHHVTPDIYSMIIFPAIFAFTYIALLPYFERFIALPIWKYHQNKLKETRAHLEKTEIFLADEKNKLIDEIIRLKKETNHLKDELLNSNAKIEEQSKLNEKLIQETFSIELEKQKIDLENQYKVALDNNINQLQIKYEKAQLLNSNNEKENNALKLNIDKLNGTILELKKKLNKADYTNNELHVHLKKLEIQYNQKEKDFQELKLENQSLLMSSNSLQKELQKYIFQLDIRLEQYENTFGKDILHIFEIIYTKNIQDKQSYKAIIDEISQHTNFPIIKIQNIFDKLIREDYISMYSNILSYEPKLKELLMEIFH